MKLKIEEYIFIAYKWENGNYFGGKELFKAEYATAESYSYTNRNKKRQEAVG